MFDIEKVIAQIQGYDENSLSVDKALAFIQKSLHLHPTLKLAEESISITDALGRVLAENIISPLNVPAHDNAAMDGFAFCYGHVSGKQTDRPIAELAIAGTLTAGDHWQQALTAKQCVRIMTGAPIPAGLDTVVPIELCEIEGALVRFPLNVLKEGEHRRLRGEDLSKGEVVLAVGRRLTPADIGLIASLGQAYVRVYCRLRVAFFSTGDELRSIGEELPPGAIYDSNRYTLRAMLQRLGCEMVDLGVIKDTPQTLQHAFTMATLNADVVLSSGGVSMGEADLVKPMMKQLGECVFWRVAMRPGRPFAFGKLTQQQHQAWLFGLPGNPVAVMVTFYILVRPALMQLMGARSETLPLLKARTTEAIRKRSGRSEYQRGHLSIDQGIPSVTLTDNQGSGVLSSMSRANCLVVLGHTQDNIAAGEQVDVLMFDGLI